MHAVVPSAAEAAENIPSVLQMQAAYEEHNSRVQASGKSRGHFMVDLCRPGHLTNCLRAFRDAIRSTEDAWDAQFGEPPPAPPLP